MRYCNVKGDETTFRPREQYGDDETDTGEYPPIAPHGAPGLGGRGTGPITWACQSVSATGRAVMGYRNP
jgi:hypothetical protein